MLKIILRLLSFIGFTISMFLPVLANHDLLGYEALGLGGLFLLGKDGALVGIAWLANISYFISFVIGPQLRLVISILSLLLATAGFLITSIPAPLEIPESGISLAFGFYLWHLSIALMLLSCLVERKKRALIQEPTLSE